MSVTDDGGVEPLGSLSSQILQSISGGGDPQAPGGGDTSPPTEKADDNAFAQALGGRSKNITLDDIAGEQPGDAQPGDALAPQGEPSVPDPAAAVTSPPGRQPPATPAAPTLPATPQQDEGLDVFEYAKSNFGVDLGEKYKTSEEAVKGLLNAYKLVGQRDQFAEWGKRLAEAPEDVYRFLHERYGQADPQAKVPQNPSPQPTTTVSSVPEWDESWTEHLDETGRPKPNADPAVLAKIKAWNDFAKTRGRDLLREPEKVVLPAIEKRLQEMIDKGLGEVKKQSEERERAASIAAQVEAEGRSLIWEQKDWVFVNGDPRQGVTPAGQVYDKYLKWTAEVDPQTGAMRVSNIRDQARLARELALVEMSKNPALYFPQQQPAAQPNNQTKQPAVQQMTRSPSSGGQKRSPGPNDPWPKGKSLADALLQYIEE